MSGIIFWEVLSFKIVGFRIVALKSLKARELEKDPNKSLFQESHIFLILYLYKYLSVYILVKRALLNFDINLVVLNV